MWWRVRSFCWLELMSHRTFMPKLLLAGGGGGNHKGWPWFQRLLVALFKFMEPYLRKPELSDPVRTLYPISRSPGSVTS